MNILSTESQPLFDLSCLGLLKISGKGAPKLLQGQLTCDIEQLSDKQGVFGAHCNPQGRVISLFHLFQVDQDYFLLLPPSLSAAASAALKKFAPFYQCSIEAGSHEFFVMGAQDNTTVFDAAASYSYPGSRRKIYLLKAAPAKALATYHDWHYLDLMEGIPAIYPETSGLFLPHDLNLTQLEAVSFSKGCYTGQEIIARMHYRGKPKNHLYRGAAKQKLTPCTEIITDGTAAGTVVDCSEQAYNNLYPLLFVANENAVKAESLQTQQGQIIELQRSE